VPTLAATQDPTLSQAASSVGPRFISASCAQHPHKLFPMMALSAMPGDVGVPLGDVGIDVDNSISETE
jgi:hypothetical protein